VTPPAAQPWRKISGGIRVLVRVTPKASRQGVEGIAETAQGPALAVRVRAPADKGEANRAVAAALAAWLDVPNSTVAVTAGGKARVKTLAVAGDAGRLAAAIEARIAELR
jgi:uncharacterized protein YggU (UPF0235/DUF167 family)